MSHEKLAAAGESSAAIANQLHTTQFTLVNRAVQALGGRRLGLWSLEHECHAAQSWRRHVDAIADAATRSAATLSQIVERRCAHRAARPQADPEQDHREREASRAGSDARER